MSEIAMLTAALRAAQALLDAELGQAIVASDLRLAQARLEIETAQVEAAAVTAAGGEKGLGPNAEAQKRMLALAVAGHEGVSLRQIGVEGLRLDVAQGQANVAYFQNVQRAFLASIGTQALVDAELVDLVLNGDVLAGADFDEEADPEDAWAEREAQAEADVFRPVAEDEFPATDFVRADGDVPF